MAPDKLLAEWFWIDRWMGSSAFLLPMAARGLYREMLTQAWRRGARLPNDFEAVKRAVGVTEAEWVLNWPLVEKYWRVKKEYLVNPTQVQIYAKTRRLRDVRSSAGRRGGLKTQALKPEAKPQATPEAKINPLSPSPSPSLIRKEREKERVSLSAIKDPFLQDEITERAGAFVRAYEALYPECLHGARYAVKPARDYASAVSLCTTWADDARLLKLARIFLTTDHQFAAEGSRTITQFLALASWCDARLAAVETGHA